LSYILANSRVNGKLQLIVIPRCDSRQIYSKSHGPRGRWLKDVAALAQKARSASLTQL
jgi:hypothetical protein